MPHTSTPEPHLLRRCLQPLHMLLERGVLAFQLCHASIARFACQLSLWIVLEVQHAGRGSIVLAPAYPLLHTAGAPTQELS